LIVWLIVLRPRAYKAIDNLSEKIHHVQTDSFLLTLEALGLTVLLAAVWPLISFLFAWRLSATKESDFSQALASALFSLVPLIFTFEFLRYFAMPRGLGQGHLRMHHEPMSFFRQLLPWFFAPTIPTAFVIEFMRAQKENEQWYNAAGRLFFLANLLIVALFLLILLRPAGPIMGPYLRQRIWLERLRYVWYPVCLGLPATFGVLAAMGYFYAARQLHVNLVMTIILILLAILTRAMFVRWLTSAQRRLALLERRKREIAEHEMQTEGALAKPSEIQQGAQEDEATIFQISRQTRRLINEITLLLPLLGVWCVWSDVLPALGKLTGIELWSIAGDEVVTIGSVALALLILVLTIAVSRNVPGLLEISLLRWLPISRGVRFTVIALFRYTLVLVGIVLAFGEIGIGWSKVQWLAAAVTVGLGFGLQEIFANFVSGLVILFEQPIRVDDVVTIADVTGKVSKIRIRATTIRRWDQRELVVPNKEFVVGRLINWTLSDNLQRLDFAVGIAYGSDTADAERILHEVARTNELVLDEPEPVVIFKAFGDNSLEFELRVYIAGMENYIPVWHGINCAIDQEFRKAGIVIAFPQRDLHIHSVDAGMLVGAKDTQVNAGGQ
ncbi:MAG: mechanosensitive ion channel domain-containing protein, partial [Planctomycetota bacterium]